MISESEKFTIIGGGFGLYGYLPALFNVFGGRIQLPIKYRKTINSRPELKQYDERVDWRPSTDAALRESNGAILAIPPKIQVSVLQGVLGMENIKKIILEKPVAHNVSAAIQLYQNRNLESKQIRVGYLFLYSKWCAIIKDEVSSSIKSLAINWCFKADHLTNNKETWKRYHSEGGGALRFYGIHLIAVLASIGYHSVVSSSVYEEIDDQPICWNAIFRDGNRPLCEVKVSIDDADTGFVVSYIDDFGIENPLYSAPSPFEFEGRNGNQDMRVAVLERLIRSFKFGDDYYNSIYRNAISLWEAVELQTVTR